MWALSDNTTCTGHHHIHLWSYSGAFILQMAKENSCDTFNPIKNYLPISHERDSVIFWTNPTEWALWKMVCGESLKVMFL